MNKSLINLIVGAIIGVAFIGFGWITLWIMEKDYSVNQSEGIKYETVVPSSYWENLDDFCVEIYELEKSINQGAEAE